MKSLIKAVAVAIVIAAPVVSFAQMNPAVSSDQTRVENSQAAVGNNTVQAATNASYGSNADGTWQAGRHRDMTVSSYSPPIYIAR